jgi:hypothetical protein
MSNALMKSYPRVQTIVDKYKGRGIGGKSVHHAHIMGIKFQTGQHLRDEGPNNMVTHLVEFKLQ